MTTTYANYSMFFQERINTRQGVAVLPESGWTRQLIESALRGGEDPLWEGLAPTIIVSPLRAEKPYGAQNYGTRITLYPRGYGGQHCRTESLFVSAKGRYEPETRNQGGRLGAWRELPDEEGITAAIAALRDKADSE